MQTHLKSNRSDWPYGAGWDGGDASGDFCQTLTITDVDTGWVDLHGLKNKAQRWTHAALECARREPPIPIKGIDTDNGSEFINHHLLNYWSVLPSAANRMICERTTNPCGRLCEPANDCSALRCSSSKTTCSVGLPLRMVNLPMEAPWQYLLAQTTSQTLSSLFWETDFRDRRLSLCVHAMTIGGSFVIFA